MAKMVEEDLNSWSEFEERAQDFHNVRSEHRRVTGDYVSDFLYRGQSNSAWHLKTTLERYLKEPVTQSDYHQLLLMIRPQVETFTDKEWPGLDNLRQYKEKLNERGDPFITGGMPVYRYMVYLRHHGFPSPLLDWTRSPYVAAYSAFRNVENGVQKVAIFAFCEYAKGHKSGSAGTPEITGLGPGVRGHRRHFQQQSQYTICTVFRDDDYYYAPHEEAFRPEEDEQDLLYKFNLPVTERLEVLRRLELYNINAFSLFGSEESLMEMLAVREELRRADSSP